MNDQQLKTLLKTVEFGSFSKAEEALFLSKPAIKKQIDALEKEIGFPLLVRTYQGITPTPAGEEFCRTVRKTMDEMEAATQKCRELALHGQVLRIENPHHPHLLLENAFAEFSRRFPYIKVQLRTSSYCVEDVVNDVADVAECTYHPDLENSGVKYMRLFPMPYKCVVAPGHPLAQRKVIHPENLTGQRAGLLEKNADLAEQLSRCSAEILLETFASNDLQNITNICYNGGVFITKASFIQSLQPLITIPLETDLVPMGVIIHRETPSQVVRSFLTVVHELYPQSKSAL